MTERFIGIDVGKSRLAICDSKTQTTSFVDNTRKAVLAFFRATKASEATLVVCEASGGYEAAVLACAADLGIAAHRANANQIKSFIASYGTLAKTDAADARAIALYAAERHRRLALWGGRDEAHDELQALVLRRDDLIAMRTAETNRLKAPGLAVRAAKKVARSCRATIAMLNRQIGKIEAAVAELIKTHEPLGRKVDVLTTIPGIGAISAVAILAHMPEIGTCTRREAASLAGVAPHPKDSGNKTGYRNVRGGRQPLRKALFMPAMVATRANSAFAVHYNRHRQNGKKPLVAITAIMRKIITIANARVRDDIIAQQS